MTLAIRAMSLQRWNGDSTGTALARRIEQISGDKLFVNQSTLYPVLRRLEQEGAVESDWDLLRTTGVPAFIV